MAQRISDILPPKKLRYPKEKKSLEVKIEPLKEKKRSQELKRGKSPFVFPKKILIPIFIIAFLGGIWSYFTLPNAKLIIWPKINEINYKVNLVVDIATKEINFAGQIISGQLIETKKDISQEFSSSGKQTVENKAQGIIRIYNNYSTSSQILITTTRFISDSGKIFRLKQKVTVPGQKTENGKLVSGYIDAEVIADKAGDDYNIGPSIFSVPGFAGTPKYTGFYGKSFSQMTGGFIGEKPQITKDDLEKAKKSLTESITKEIDDSLKSKIPAGFILVEDATQEKIMTPVFSAKIGDNLAVFSGQVSAESKGIIFKVADLERFAHQYFSSQTQNNPSFLKENKKIQTGSLKINYSADKLDLPKGKLFLNLTVKVKIFTDLDLDLLKKDLAGFSQKEISDFFEKQAQINKVEVKLWPFWVKNIPNNPEKIKIELMFLEP